MTFGEWREAQAIAEPFVFEDFPFTFRGWLEKAWDAGAAAERRRCTEELRKLSASLNERARNPDTDVGEALRLLVMAGGVVDGMIAICDARP